MLFDETQQGKFTILHLKGELLGGENAHIFRDKLKEFIAEGKRDIVIDLSKVTYINSSGIGMLVSGLTTMTQAEGKLKLVGVEDNIRNIFVITNLVSVFKCYKTVEEAANAV